MTSADYYIYTRKHENSIASIPPTEIVCLDDCIDRALRSLAIGKWDRPLRHTSDPVHADCKAAMQYEIVKQCQSHTTS